MIVEFSVKNFRSIRELQTVSFVATGLKSSPEHEQVDSRNIAIEGDTRLLKTVGIYGANGSGKSNVIKALDYFLEVVKSEASSESNLGNLYDPFLYQENRDQTSSFFQIILIVNNRKFRYGFTVKRNLQNNPSGSPVAREYIEKEWLFGTKEKNSGEYFTRDGQTVSKELLSDHQKIPDIPYSHTLFLTHAAAFDSSGVCALIKAFIRRRTICNLQDGFQPFRFNTLFLIEEEKKKAELLKLLSAFNLQYSDIIVERDGSALSLVTHEKVFLVKTIKEKEKEYQVPLNLALTESSGTQKLFDLAGMLLRAFILNAGGLIVIDEIDSNFHPSLLIKLVELFNTPELNTANVQLLFTSHDTNLLSPSIMRRDQFYFTEKNEDQSTRVYSLADLKGIRNDADFARQYLMGFYGGLPVLSDYVTPETESNGTLGTQDW